MLNINVDSFQNVQLTVPVVSVEDVEDE